MQAERMNTKGKEDVYSEILCVLRDFGADVLFTV